MPNKLTGNDRVIKARYLCERVFIKDSDDLTLTLSANRLPHFSGVNAPLNALSGTNRVLSIIRQSLNAVYCLPSANTLTNTVPSSSASISCHSFATQLTGCVALIITLTIALEALQAKKVDPAVDLLRLFVTLHDT